MRCECRLLRGPAEQSRRPWHEKGAGAGAGLRDELSRLVRFDARVTLARAGSISTWQRERTSSSCPVLPWRCRWVSCGRVVQPPSPFSDVKTSKGIPWVRNSVLQCLLKGVRVNVALQGLDQMAVCFPSSQDDYLLRQIAELRNTLRQSITARMCIYVAAVVSSEKVVL